MALSYGNQFFAYADKGRSNRDGDELVDEFCDCGDHAEGSTKFGVAVLRHFYCLQCHILASYIFFLSGDWYVLVYLSTKMSETDF